MFACAVCPNPVAWHNPHRRRSASLLHENVRRAFTRRKAAAWLRALHKTRASRPRHLGQLPSHEPRGGTLTGRGRFRIGACGNASAKPRSSHAPIAKPSSSASTASSPERSIEGELQRRRGVRRSKTSDCGSDPRLSPSGAGPFRSPGPFRSAGVLACRIAGLWPAYASLRERRSSAPNSSRRPRAARSHERVSALRRAFSIGRVPSRSNATNRRRSGPLSDRAIHIDPSPRRGIDPRDPTTCNPLPATALDR